MLDEIKISYVVIIDNQNKYKEGLSRRIWHHEKFIKTILERESCILGRKTFDITNWKGPNSWVITKDRNWKRSGIGTIHSIDDIHLHIEDKLYVIGGMSLYEQLENYIDEIHLYIFNNKEGDLDWIPFDMKNWKPIDFFSNEIWSYAKLEKKKK